MLLIALRRGNLNRKQIVDHQNNHRLVKAKKKPFFGVGSVESAKRESTGLA
jgi:hypothetical protein